MAEAATVKGLRIYDPQKTEDAFNFDKDAVGYPFTRTQLRCIMGIDASSTSEAYGIGPMPDSGEVCQRLLELSAEEWLKGSPDKWRDVLGPLRDILKNKGVAPTNDNARYTADKLTDIVRNNPAIANSTSSFEVSNIFEGQREPFRIFPGFMHYLEYVDGIFEKQEKGKLPPDPGFSEEMLRSNTRECREADGTLTNLQCMQTARGNLHHPIKGKIVAGL